jgi:polyhydroxyalkanoate synthesis regulator phasin
MSDDEWIRKKLDDLEQATKKLTEDVDALEERLYKLRENILAWEIQEFLSDFY